MKRPVISAFTGVLVAALLVLVPPPAQAVDWNAVSSRSVMKDAAKHFATLPISAVVYKSGLKRKMTMRNSTGKGYSVTVWRRQEGKASVKVGSVFIPSGSSRSIRWTTGRCRGEVAAAVTYVVDNRGRYKFHTSWPKPMRSAAKRC